MSRIEGVGSNVVQRLSGQGIARTPGSEAADSARGSDKLELSGVSHLLRSLKANDIRTDKVAAVRAQIEAGTYDDDQKLDLAIDRLLDDLLK